MDRFYVLKYEILGKIVWKKTVCYGLIPCMLSLKDENRY